MSESLSDRLWHISFSDVNSHELGEGEKIVNKFYFLDAHNKHGEWNIQVGCERNYAK